MVNDPDAGMRFHEGVTRYENQVADAERAYQHAHATKTPGLSRGRSILIAVFVAAVFIALIFVLAFLAGSSGSGPTGY